MKTILTMTKKKSEKIQNKKTIVKVRGALPGQPQQVQASVVKHHKFK